MLSLIGSGLAILGPLFLFFIKIFLSSKEAKQKAVKNYYEFIAQIDKKSATKVANYLAAENELGRIQREIRERTLIEVNRLTERPAVNGLYDVPEIIELNIELKTHGKYLTETGQAKGLVVHFTAGRFAEGRQDAFNTLSYLAKQGLGCLVLDIDGKLYKAKNQALTEISFHAGESAYLGHKGMSRYCLGIEICNAGKLEDDFKPWYGGPAVPEDERREVTEQTANQKPGIYHKFSAAQEKTLIGFVLWQLDVNPEFSIDFVIGHDECAPERKNDPGASLSMTMPDFRAMIKTRI